MQEETFLLNPYQYATTEEVVEELMLPLQELVCKETNPLKREFLEKVVSTLKDWYR